MLLSAISWMLQHRKLTTAAARGFFPEVNARVWSRNPWPRARTTHQGPPQATELERYFDEHQSGLGLWKWRHYFEIYERHFQKFVGRDVNVMEIGIYSGGSLEMWKRYFGPRCTVYGVDIQPECKAYEDERTKIFIGDQADRDFWRTALRQMPRPLDIVIDDGGHAFEQQRVTLEETLPSLAAGGVYLCEDVHGAHSQFLSYVGGLIGELSAAHPRNLGNGSLAADRSSFQQSIHSVHSYPFVVVIEKAAASLDRFVAPRHGTEWQPFLEKRLPTEMR